MPTCAATSPVTRSADRNDASQTTNTPSGKCAAEAAAAASATAVFPTPPGPVTVVNEDEVTVSAISASSRSLPTSARERATAGRRPVVTLAVSHAAITAASLGDAYRAAMAASRSRAASASRRRQRRLARKDHDLTPDEWATLQTLWGGCAYCGDAGPMQRDCVLPISRGGRYTIANVVPACRSCNTSKCNAEVTIWMRRKRLDERTFLTRHAEILGRLIDR